LSADALYTPFEVPYRMSMGLMRLQAAEWFEVDRDWAADLAEKRRLLAERHDELVGVAPGSEAAQAALLALLARHLAACHPGHYRLDGGVLHLAGLEESWRLDRSELAPIDLAGRLVQEDLCLMQHDGRDWRLTAASVCFPTRWRLADKMGRPLQEIHAPVPQFQERLERPVVRFFDSLKPERPVWRLNWSLLDDPALYQSKGHGRLAEDPGITPENAGEKVWLRVERQTLTRLPGSDAILFTIRIHRWPLARLARLPEAAARMRQSLETMPEATQRYKSMPVFGRAVRAWLANLEATP
jgi:Haem-dependent oxidative N-demethylase, alpha subunit-like